MESSAGNLMTQGEPVSKKPRLEDEEEDKCVTIKDEGEFNDESFLKDNPFFSDFYYKTRIVFYKNGEECMQIGVALKDTMNVSRYDRAEVFVPEFSPYVKKIYDNKYSFLQERKCRKYTIDLSGVTTLTIQSNPCAIETKTLDYNFESDSDSSDMDFCCGYTSRLCKDLSIKH